LSHPWYTNLDKAASDKTYDKWYGPINSLREDDKESSSNYILDIDMLILDLSFNLHSILKAFQKTDLIVKLTFSDNSSFEGLISTD